jgi:hypothetical protein
LIIIKSFFQLYALRGPQLNSSLVKFVIEKTPQSPPPVKQSWVTTTISLKATELRLKKMRKEKYKPHIYPVRFVTKTGVIINPSWGRPLPRTATQTSIGMSMNLTPAQQRSMQLMLRFRPSRQSRLEKVEEIEIKEIQTNNFRLIKNK